MIHHVAVSISDSAFCQISLVLVYFTCDHGLRKIERQRDKRSAKINIKNKALLSISE